MRDARSADTPSRSGTVVRGQLNERQWQDVRKACRTTRREGISLIVHGVKTVAPLRQCRRKGAKQEQHGQALEFARPMQLSDGDSSPPPLSKRQQRSHDRLLDYQMRKRKQLLGASTRVQRFLQQYRWQRMQDVWTMWQRRRQIVSNLRNLLWREWKRPYTILMVGGGSFGSHRDRYIGRRAALLCERAGIPRTLERAPRKRVSPGKRAHTVSPKPSSPSAPCAVDSRGKKSRALVLEPSSGV